MNLPTNPAEITEAQALQYLAYRKLERKFLKFWRALTAAQRSQAWNSLHPRETGTCSQFMQYFLDNQNTLVK